jgi:hypothetical protein
MKSICYNVNKKLIHQNMKSHGAEHDMRQVLENWHTKAEDFKELIKK